MTQDPNHPAASDRAAMLARLEVLRAEYAQAQRHFYEHRLTWSAIAHEMTTLGGRLKALDADAAEAAGDHQHAAALRAGVACARELGADV